MVTAEFGQQAAQWIQNIALFWVGIIGTVACVLGIIGGTVAKQGKAILYSLGGLILIQIALPVGRFFYRTISSAPHWMVASLLISVLIVGTIVSYAGLIQSILNTRRNRSRELLTERIITNEKAE